MKKYDYFCHVMISLFDKIREKRLELNIKSSELAQKLNIDQALISKFENGKRIPTRTQIIQLAKALNINVDDLLVLYTKELIYKEIGNDYIAYEALSLVKEEIIEYQKLSKNNLSDSIKNILKEIDALKNKLNNIRLNDSYRISQALELEYTYESNRIEGNTLTLNETDLVINEGLTISGKSMREHLEAINHQDAIEYVKQLIDKNSQIDERTILSIHNLILRGINKEYAGKYRNVQVMIKGSKHLPPQAYLVPKQMEDLLLWYYQNKSNMHPVVLAAEMHQRLVTIHPFIDGNGRTSRLLMNLILLKNGFVIANLKGDTSSRLAYYNSLEKSQINNTEKEDFIMLIAKQELENLKTYIKILS